MAKPLPTRHRGIEFANVHPLIANVCSRPEGGVDWALLKAAQETLSLDDLLDIAEIETVGRSWRDAIQGNLEFQRERERQTPR